MSLTPWQFEARCERVVDGDTQVYVAKLYEDIERKFYVRLLGVNTPDSGIDGATWEEEKAATEYAKSWLFEQEDGVFTVSRPLELYLTGKTGKYGREIGMIYRENGRGLSDDLVTEGYGKFRSYAAHVGALSQGRR